MSAKITIKDGEGSGEVAGVTSFNALKVTTVPLPSGDVPPGVLTSQRFFSEVFSDSTNSTDQRVVGTLASPVLFTLGADEGVTKYVTSFRMIIESPALNLGNTEFNRYGAAAAAPGLTNGILLQVEQGGVTVPINAQPILTMGDYVNWSQDFTNLLGVASAAADYVNFDFIFPVPIVLPQGTADRLVIQIRDDLTALTSQFTLARGYQEFV
jgi:hypothetical protein